MKRIDPTHLDSRITALLADKTVRRRSRSSSQSFLLSIGNCEFVFYTAYNTYNVILLDYILWYCVTIYCGTLWIYNAVLCDYILWYCVTMYCGTLWIYNAVLCDYILWYCVTMYCGTLWIYNVVLWWLYIVVFTLWLWLGFLRICRHFLSFTVEDYSPTTVVDSHFSIKDTRLSTLQRLAEKCSNGSKTCNKIVCCYQIATVSGLTITVSVTFFVYI